jgi:RHS repeat-associated protein
MQNQGETGIDCGGPCSPCETTGEPNPGGEGGNFPASPQSSGECGLPPNTPYAQLSSFANVGTGSYSHSQTLFSATGPFATDLSLNYNSLNRNAGPMGRGWNHSYDAYLYGPTETDTNHIYLRSAKGEVTVYTLVNGSYLPPPGDTSALTVNGDNSKKLSNRNGVAYTFNPDGRLVLVADQFGRQTSLSYTGVDLTQITDNQGRVTTLNYDLTATPTHLLISVIDPAGKSYDLQYQDGRLWRVINPLADALSTERGYWEYTYNDKGLLATKRDPSGNVSSNIYFNDLRIQSSTDPEGAVDPTGHRRSLSYSNPSGSIMTTTFTEKDGGVWLYTYDTQKGKLISKLGPNENGSQGTKGKFFYYYPDSGYLKARIEPFGTTANPDNRTTFYRYDGYGNLTGVTEPLAPDAYGNLSPDSVDTGAFGTTGNPSWAFVYSYTPVTLNNVTFDAVSTITDQRNGQVTSFFYDTAGGALVTSIIDPRNQGNIIRYNANGTVREIIDANNTTVSTNVSEKEPSSKTTFLYYDAPEEYAAGIGGLLKSITGMDGVTTTVTGYDALGNPTGVTVTDSNGIAVPVSTTLVNDALGRITSVTRASTYTPKVFDDQMTSFGYNLAGDLTSLTDAEHQTTTYTPNYRGQVTAIIDALQNITRITYREVGCPDCGGGSKIASLQDPRAAARGNPGTVYSYDYWGRMTLETDPLQKKMSYTYYDDGLVKEKYDATNGLPGTLLVSYEYNERGQLTKRTYNSTPQVIENYVYNPDGTLQSASSPSITYTFAWHTIGPNRGRLQSVTDNRGYTINYGDYDGIGERKTVTFFSGTADQRVITYDYDSANRPWRITDNFGTSGNTADDLTFTYGYDERGRRWTLSFPNQITATYGYDDLDQLTSLTHQVNDGGNIVSFAYPIYDNMGNRKERSVTADTTTAETYVYDLLYRIYQTATTNNGTEEFHYDAAGNRTSGPGPMDTRYVTDLDSNRMISGRLFDYGYDNRGNQTTRALPVNGADKSWIQSWDGENRLVKVEKTRGTEVRTVTFAYDPFGRRIGKTFTIKRGATTLVNQAWSYVYDDEDIALEVFTDTGGAQTKTFVVHGPGIDEPLALVRGGQYYTYHADALGSIYAIVDSTHNVVERYTYDTYGKPAPQTRFRNSYSFTGRELDKEAGLLYYRERYKDLLDGSFLSKDPLGFSAGDVNLWNYVGQNPGNWVDPYGLMELPPNPKGLPPSWERDYQHRDPNGQRFRDPCGRPLDWHPAKPGAPGWGGRDHWHDPENFGRKHLPPGTQVPDPAVPKSPPWWMRLPKFIPGPFPIVILPPGWENTLPGAPPRPL